MKRRVPASVFKVTGAGKFQVAFLGPSSGLEMRSTSRNNRAVVANALREGD
jgi:hypothetical protein